MFPRLLAVAERAWHPAKWAVPYNYDGAIYNKDSGTFTAAMRADRDAEFNTFSNVLGQKELAKLDVADVAYRIPTVGAVVESGKLHANVIFPGLGIEYRVDGGKWMSYSQPVAVSGDVEVRALSGDGKRPGRSLKVN
jgi:hexosaminidase